MRNFAILSFIIVLLALAGCQAQSSSDGTPTGQIILDDDDFVFLDDLETDDNQTNQTDLNESNTSESLGDQQDLEDIQREEQATEEELQASDIAYTVEVVEGDLVSLDLQAVDPDGDSLTFSFTDPLNEQGRWQTQIGDEGRYLATVTATDGRLSSSEDVLIIVGRANRAPVIECPESLTVKEGETVYIDCNIYDEEGDNIFVSYEGWATSSSKETSFEDAGEYTVLIRATDPTNDATQTLTVFVENVNRAPLIAELEDISIMETNTILVEPQVTDPDGDEVTLSFSSPLDNDGLWLTDDGDAGTYEVTVTASDGAATATQKFSIDVSQINTAPVLKAIADIEVEEGDEISLSINAYDPEGDELIVTYSGFMESDEYTTSFDDAGSYDQTVTVSDGVLSTTDTFTITVIDKNRPPVFVFEGG